MSVRNGLIFLCGAMLLGTTIGCRRHAPTSVAEEPPVVCVAEPVVRNVLDCVDLTGRIDAPQNVDIRARVTGYLVAMPFQEGAEVKANAMLFEIDPRPYQAQWDNAQAHVGVCKAQVKLATADNERAKQLNKINPASISAQELDKYQAAQEEAVANLAAAKASLETCQLNLDFTKVTAPVAGQVSRYYLTLGNLVNQDSTLLTTIVSQDPMYAYFDLDEPTVLRILRTLRAQKEKREKLSERHVEVDLGLADEKGFPHKGNLDFANNKVDPSTGTLSVRGVFANPPSPSGVRLLRPGMFVRMRLPLDEIRDAVLVPDAAIGTDQGDKYLLVVNAQSVVEYRRVTPGPLEEDGLRVIRDGLKPKEKVIVSGLQMARPRMKVKQDVVQLLH